MSRGELFQYSHRDPSEWGQPRDYHFDRAVTPAPWEHVERDRLDREVEEYLQGLGKWHDFSPAWDTSTGVTSENGTWTEARYTRIGDTVHFACMYTCGTTFSTGAGQERWEFNVPGLLPYNAGPFIAWTRFRDVNQDNYYAPGIVNQISDGTFYNVYASGATTGTNYNINSMSGTVPFTFASGDEMYFEGTFEAEPIT